MKLSMVLALVCAINSAAGDWLQFRGPQSSGVAIGANLPSKVEPRNIAWKTALPGRGLSSPIIVGQRVFVTATTGRDRLHVLCFDAATGGQLWERRFWATGRTLCHEKISLAAPSPASDGARIYALFSSNDLFCLDLDGNLLWLRGLMRDYPNASNGLGLSASPVVADGVLIAQIETDGDAFALGLDTLTGQNRWKIARPRRVNWTTPTLTKGADDRHIAILQSSTGILGIDPSSGREIWNYGEGASAIPSSALSGSVLYAPASGITALELSASGQPPKQLWRAPQLRTGTPSPVVLDDRVYILNDGGILTCAQASDGKRVWQARLKGPFTASPLVAGQHLYTVSEKGLLQIVDPAKPEGEVVSELDLGETILGTPSISSDALYLRSDGHLWKISAPAPALL